MKNVIVSALIIASALVSIVTPAHADLLPEETKMVKTVTIENGKHCFINSDNNMLSVNESSMAKQNQQYVFDTLAIADCVNAGYEKISYNAYGNQISMYKDTTYNFCALSSEAGLPIGAFMPCDLLINKVNEFGKQIASDYQAQPAFVDFKLVGSKTTSGWDASNTTNINPDLIQDSIIIVMDYDNEQNVMLVELPINSQTVVQLPKEQFKNCSKFGIMYQVDLKDGTSIKSNIHEFTRNK